MFKGSQENGAVMRSEKKPSEMWDSQEKLEAMGRDSYHSNVSFINEMLRNGCI